jgi:D-alanine transaminase
METLGYYNGETAPLEEMRIPMNDRAGYFGDGVYEAAITANYRIFTLDEHLDRLFRSAALLRIEPDITKAALGTLLTELVRKLDSPNQIVYWQLSRGTAFREHSFPEKARPNLWVMLRPFTLPDIRKKIALITLEDTRFLHCNIKTLNLLPNVLAAEQAKQAGAYEAVFHRGDRVTECAHSNVHILKDGVFRTAPADNLILAGISRAHIIALCKKFGVAVEEKPFTVAEMREADEVLVSSTGVFCAAANRIDGKAVGGKAPELLEKIQAAMLEEFRLATAL